MTRKSSVSPRVDHAPADDLAVPAREIRAYIAAMSTELADLAAQIGREDIEQKLREAAKAGMRSC